MSQTNYPPRHVAIIMDGNGRWAKKRRLPRLAGHIAGGENIRPVVKIFANYGVKYLTLLYVLHTELEPAEDRGRRLTQSSSKED